METIKRLNQIALSLGVFGFIPALFLYGQTEGLRMDTDKEKALDSISVVIVHGVNTFDEMALRYCFISACFLLFIMLVLVRNDAYLKLIGLIPLAFIATQCRLLITEKTELFESEWVYSSWLKIVLYMDYSFLALALVLLILQLYSIFLIYRSPSLLAGE